jgi:ferredoxin-type protein NapH
VCPVNLLTDFAYWLRVRLGLKGSAHISRPTRYWMLGMTLAVAAITGSIAWEMVNPVSMMHRGLIFGLGLAWAVLLAVFLFDLFVMRHGWCGHLCPVGAFYSLVGRFSLTRIKLPARAACNDCMDCFAVCPEPQVIRPALKAIAGTPPLILEANCTNCGRCIDVCSKDVFAFGTRFNTPVVSVTGAPHAAPK